ncbi:MAG: hypothetical protein ACUVWN_00920 [bacterium]
MKRNLRIISVCFLSFYLLFIFFLISGLILASSSSIVKNDVSDSVIVPENYENLLVLDFTIIPEEDIEKDTLLQNSQAGSSPGNILSAFRSTDWYIDHNDNQKFDGNQIENDNEATLYSSDDILSTDDYVKNTGAALIKAFKYSAGVYEQYIDNDHSNSYTSGEAVVRTHASGVVLSQGDVVRSGTADMTEFPAYVRFTDNNNSLKYDDGEAVILDSDPVGILSNADTIIMEGTADLKPIPINILYADSDNNGKYSIKEPIVIDSGIIGELDPEDLIIRDGNVNLKGFSTELYADSNCNNRFDKGELIVIDQAKDMKVQSEDIKRVGKANLRNMAEENLFYSDSNNDNLFNLSELIIRDTGEKGVLEQSDQIVKPGSANLKSFEVDIDKFFDGDGNGIYSGDECIIMDNNANGVVEPNEVRKPGKVLLIPFSGKNYLFTDADNNGKYTGDIDLTDGYNGEAIFKDINIDGNINNGELVTTGYAPIQSYGKKLWFIDVSKNGAYDSGEAFIMSDDNLLTTDDIIARSGPAFLAVLPEGAMKWADVDNDSKYNDGELIISSADNILSHGEVIKPGICGLKLFPIEYSGYLYSDSDGNNSYSKDYGIYEMIVESNDRILDSSDIVIVPGKANLKRFVDINLLFLDSNNNAKFDSTEPIIENSDPIEGRTMLDSSDIVLRSGTLNVRNFEDNIVYIDNNNDGYFQGDSDGDVTWDANANPMSANNPNIFIDGDEVMLDDPLGDDHLKLDKDDTVIRPGLALLTNFEANYVYADNGNNEYDGDANKEAIIKDNNSNQIIDSTDEILITGNALIKDFDDVRFIDDNNDLQYSSEEAIWKDTGEKLNWLDPDDAILKSGYASLLPMGMYKYMSLKDDDSFSGNQALIVDDVPEGILDRNDVQAKPGDADVKTFDNTYEYIDCNGNSTYDDGEPILRILGNNTYILNPGVLKTFSGNTRYIDSDRSGFYNAVGSPPVKTSFIEAIIKDNGDKELSSGALDGTGVDTILVPGTANIRPIGNFINKLEPPNPKVNAYIDRTNDRLLSDFDVLIKDNPPTGILDSNDIIFGKVDYNLDNKYYWSGTKLVRDESLGSRLNPPNPLINAYIDAYDFGSLSDFEILLTDNDDTNAGKLDSKDIIWGEIKDKNSMQWAEYLEDELPWRTVIKAFQSYEKFLTSLNTPEYNGQPIISELTGNTENVWDNSDLMVYTGTPPVGLNNNWGNIKYVDDNHDDTYNGDECILDFDLVPNNWDVVYPDIVITPGKAGFKDFQAELKFSDTFPKNNSYDVDEALIIDLNNNNMIDQGEVISAGMVGSNKLLSPMRYIDSNNDSIFSADEAIIVDSSSNNLPNGLLDKGMLDGTGIDQVISSGKANLKRFNRSEKFTDSNRNRIFDEDEAIVYDWYDPISFDGEFILSGDHVSGNGSLRYLSPGNRTHDSVLVSGNANAIRMNNRIEQKYIDFNNSGSYNGFYDMLKGNEYEPVIFSVDNILNEGRIDNTGTDRLSASGYCFHSWNYNYCWTDSNHDGRYQNNEAIIFDAEADTIIRSIGTSDDIVIVSGEAGLSDFAYMKFVDANGDNKVDWDNELVVKDINDDDKVSNEEIIFQGTITFLQPFVSSDYRYCDWDNDGTFDPLEESIVYTPSNPDILEPVDEIVASGYPILTSFTQQPKFIDYNHDGIYQEDEAVIIGGDDGIIKINDDVIVPGRASSFDGTDFKYSAFTVSDLYDDSLLIAESQDSILYASEIIKPGRANIINFNADRDRFSDNNNNDRYDPDEAIVIDERGDPNLIEEGDTIFSGYAGLRSFEGTKYKYSDSGDRDQLYNYGELLIRDDNDDDNVDKDEIIDPGFADLKEFSSDIMYTDYDNDNVYSGEEAIILTSDDILQSSDTVLYAGKAGLHIFEANTYRFADSDHDDQYSANEAIIVEANWSISDDILEKSDIIILEGDACIRSFPPDTLFLDDNANSDSFEAGEAIVFDKNGNRLLDPEDEIITKGRSALNKFSTTERYIDGSNRNDRYDADEAIIRDGNGDGKLSSGKLDGTGVDTVLAEGRAGLSRFSNNERYVDSNGNGQYDGNEDIYLDNDNNQVVTGEGDNQLKYIVIQNIGSAVNSDLSRLRLWADRDDDGIFEPDTDDAPQIKSLVNDPSNPAVWYEGPAGPPALSFVSNRASIGYPIPRIGKRFFVSVDTARNPVDGSTIKMSIPLGGVGLLYGDPIPKDMPIINSYIQRIDSKSPNIPIILSLKANDVIYGRVLLRADVSDSVQVGKVEFYDGPPEGNNFPISIDEDGPPWETFWDCINAGFGQHFIYARVYDKTYLNQPKIQTIKHYNDSIGTLVIIALTKEIQLNSGWNYFSLPFEPYDSDVRSVLSAIGSSARSIWTYDASTSKWLRYDLDGPDFLNDLYEIHAGRGYIIFMSAPGMLKIIGTKPDSKVQLVNGWNFVGCNSFNPINIVDALSTIISYDPAIWTIDKITGEWKGYDSLGTVNDLNILEPCNAYWIYVEGNCIWDLER